MQTTLREARKAAGMSQVGLSLVSGVHPQVIRNIEAARSAVPNASWRTVALLSRALRADPRDLFRFDDHAKAS